MPDLQLASQPQVPGHAYRLADTDGWGLTLGLMVIGMLFVCFLFRKRLMRGWRGLMET